MATKNSQVVELKPINLKSVVLELESVSPLIVHAWSTKVKKQMLDKQMKKAVTAKTAKDPEQDFKDCLYFDEAGDYAFPVIAFKAAAVKAGGRFSDGMKMTELRGMFFINGEMTKIIGDEPTMREDMVRIAGGTADIRYRPQFTNWSVKLSIKYNADAISIDQLVNIFNLAGFGVGVGEWRPEKNGQFGMFRVKTE